MISLIVAVSRNNVIGVEGDLPWKLSDDLKRFKALTMGKPIIMGRLTFESIGRALPGRQNIVLTRQANFSAEGCEVVTSPAAALAAAGEADEIMIIGGSQIYSLFTPKATRLYVTAVDVDIAGDAYFPDIDSATWTMTAAEAHAADTVNQHAFEFRVYERTR